MQGKAPPPFCMTTNHPDLFVSEYIKDSRSCIQDKWCLVSRVDILDFQLNQLYYNDCHIYMCSMFSDSSYLIYTRKAGMWRASMCRYAYIIYIYININHHYNIVLEPAKHLPSSKNPAFVLISIGLFFMFSIYRMSTAHAGWASARIHLNTFASPAKNSR